MSILGRFSDIINANINALMDKWEDPAKMLAQYERKMAQDLDEVKRETAGVMAEESRTKRLVDENAKEVSKFAALAKKALQAQNETDARVFLSKKQALEATGAGLLLTHAVARENATKIRQMHDKLAKDMNELKTKKQMLLAKEAIAKTTRRINSFTSPSMTEGAIGAFKRMEEKVERNLDKEMAITELNSLPIDEANALELKYHSFDDDSAVDAELEKMKSELSAS